MRKRVLLSENDLPDRWYNIIPDLPAPLPGPLNPATLEPLKPQDLAELLPQKIIEHEFTRERWVDIPEEVREVYKIWRPSPLVRASQLERSLDTPARIYFKYEGVSPSGSHKPNTAVVQAYYAAQEGVRRLTTETGAGQWGSALSFAGSLFGLEVNVYMVRASFEQKPYRKSLMQSWGAQVFASPTSRTEAGRAILTRDPESSGSIGIAISEAVEDALSRDDTKFALGSIMNNVLLHQSVIGLEAKKQMEIMGDYPDAVIACVGGGSNFAGLTYPFLQDRLNGDRPHTRFIAAEPEACPTLTRGKLAYDFADTAGLTPPLYMHTLGHDFIPGSIHAGGLRYHGDAPSLCLLKEHGLIEARAFPQTDVFEAAVRFARSEGFVIAPESAHGLQAAVIEALAAREAGEQRVILFNISGHGNFDLAAFDAFLAGALENPTVTDEQIVTSLSNLPSPAAAV
ncbi:MULTISPECIES: TrpB-like pyridoxal phosphate-dependent enzyme [Kitasatospora]|uniref:Tryptophan synthase beta chain n=1 Tax=Kitasatospora cathayae TaxID=3004092 RepID=A0ABY7QF94_9ACTN|nr:TrpB-like pyridoxal phosphate-dependent enzyme [Kitasatospora sp. HUAS 3-15]WBP90909.1 TrpB-like pyridoxal phosphate-dependent enzyme [Kitasatospora sp. HUAS 3-15]